MTVSAFTGPKSVRPLEYCWNVAIRTLGRKWNILGRETIRSILGSGASNSNRQRLNSDSPAVQFLKKLRILRYVGIVEQHPVACGWKPCAARRNFIPPLEDYAEALEVFQDHIDRFWFCDNRAYQAGLDLAPVLASSDGFRLIQSQKSGAPKQRLRHVGRMAGIIRFSNQAS